MTCIWTYRQSHLRIHARCRHTTEAPCPRPCQSRSGRLERDDRNIHFAGASSLSRLSVAVVCSKMAQNSHIFPLKVKVGRYTHEAPERRECSGLPTNPDENPFQAEFFSVRSNTDTPRVVKSFKSIRATNPESRSGIFSYLVSPHRS